ncbi:MAG: hypothetical protein ACP5T1_07270, partial [Thermoplasmata archaeon]
VLVTAAHTLIKISKRFRDFYLRIVRRVGKNRAIIAVARKLAEIIYVMLKKKEEYQEDENISKLYYRKIKTMMLMGNNKGSVDLKKDIKNLIKSIRIT